MGHLANVGLANRDESPFHGIGSPYCAAMPFRRPRPSLPKRLVAALALPLAIAACGSAAAPTPAAPTPVAPTTVASPPATAPQLVDVPTSPASAAAPTSTGTPTSGLAAGSASTLAGAAFGQPVPGLAEANERYITYAAGILATLAADVATLRADLARSDTAAARADWLTAQLEWERVGASYDSFGPLGLAVDGLPDGLPGGVEDPGFGGLHRLEYGLWHGQSLASLVPVADKLATDVAALSTHLGDPDVAGSPGNLSLRVHEILEDALRDHLSGIDDEGAGAAYAMTSADVDAARAVLEIVAPLVNDHLPQLVATATNQMNELEAALDGAKSSGTWLAPAATPLAARQRVDAAIGRLLETLVPVPDLLMETD